MGFHKAKRLILTQLLAVCVFVWAAYVAAEESLETLVVQTSEGKEIEYKIEIADTTESRRTGLMYRREMPSNQGMLLDFEAPQKVAIWMKNTYLSLDIVYIDENGRIIKIVPDAVPLSTRTMPSNARVRAVLELNAGQTAYHGISAGDKVIHRVFEQQD